MGRAHAPLRSWVAAAAAALLLALGPGCTIRELVLAPDAPAEAKPLPSELAARFAYAPLAIAPTLERLEETEDYEKSRGEYEAPCPVTGARRKVVFEMWRTRRGSEGPRPVVVIVPILAGRYPECDHLGRLVAGEGMHAFFVHREDNLLAFDGAAADEPFETKLRRSLVNIRRTLDWVSAQPFVDGGRVGLVGISLGAIAGSILMAVEPRIDGGILIMGGADLPEVIATSIETPVKRWRTAKLRALDGNIGRVKAEVRRLLPSDPLDFAPFVGPRRVQQYIALYDNKVPTATQWKLWEALGRPEGFAIPIGHYTAIFYLDFAEENALRFLRSRLGVETRAARDAAPGAGPGEGTAAAARGAPLDTAAGPR
jgi:hypothetical protein